MLNLERQTFEFQCPRCRFHNRVTLGQAKMRAVVICRGCKAGIRLDDRMNECRLALRRVRHLIEDFEQSLKSLNLTIKL